MVSNERQCGEIMPAEFQQVQSCYQGESDPAQRELLGRMLSCSAPELFSAVPGTVCHVLLANHALPIIAHPRLRAQQGCNDSSQGGCFPLLFKKGNGLICAKQREMAGMVAGCRMDLRGSG